MKLDGIHHITAITADAPRTFDFLHYGATAASAPWSSPPLRRVIRTST